MFRLSRKETFARLSIGFSGIMAFCALSFCALPGSAQLIRVTDLVSDDTSVHPAALQDPKLINVWGLSYSPTGPFWVSNNGSATSTLYSVNASTDAVAKVAITANIPGDGSVTGQVFNPTAPALAGGSFNKDTFLFVSEDGTISGWRAGIAGNNAETFVAASADNVYKGAALAVVGAHTYLYAANFKQGTIDVLNENHVATTLAGSFTDPNLPTGYAPFNIQLLNGQLYVTYALQDSAKHDDVAGAGNGFVSEFNLDGTFVARVGSGGTLDSPWGLAIAPTTWGTYANDLLVGNFGDGRINIFDPNTDIYLGQLQDETHNPLTIDGLWALTPGNGGSAGSKNNIYFSAGPDGESHGLFGSLQSVPEPGTVATLLALGATAGLGLLQGKKSKNRTTSKS